MSLTLVVLLVAGLATPRVLPGLLPDVRGRLPWFPAPTCTDTVLEVVVAPLVADAVTRALAGAQHTRLPDGSCLQVQVRPQAPSDTVAGSTVLPAGSAPQLWVSDSSLWATQVRTWTLAGAGSFGSTPVALVTKAATVAALGWTAKPPTWAAALDGTRHLAAPQLATNSAGLLALQALWQTGDGGTAAERRLAAALLAIGRDGSTSEEQALRAAAAPPGASATGSRAAAGAGQPLVASTEQAVLALNRDSDAPGLVAVYPAEGSPVLDFPVLRVAPEDQDAAHRAATDVVVATLLGPRGRAAARALGLRAPDGTDPPTGVGTSAPQRLAAPPPAVQSAFLTRLATIAAPSRILVVMDVSLSMTSAVPGTGLSRLELAGAAAVGAGTLLTEASSAGLWVFARNLDGTSPYLVLTPVAPLGRAEGGGTHRTALITQLETLDRHVAGGGTGLYRTALDAVRDMRSSYDPRAVNTVVVFTDGTNENSPELSLPQLVAALAKDAAAQPGRPVRLLGIGIGPTADLAALRAMTAPTGGAAYRADTPAQMQQVLYDALAKRS